MKELYTIGEVSAMLGISTQTIRYYDKIGLATPAVVDRQTGYRRYSYDQIHFFDRIRYLQEFGLSLSDIRQALEKNSVQDLVGMLKRRKDQVQKEIAELENTKENINWYIDYYSHLGTQGFPKILFKTREKQRYVFASPFHEGESIYGTAGARLTKEKAKKKYAGLNFLRQNGYVLDFDSLLKGEIKPISYYVFLKEKPEEAYDYVQEVPAGEYLCARTRLLAEPFRNDDLMEVLNEWQGQAGAATGKPKPIVLANEYEDNFYYFKECIYEIQILIGE
jgi:DNA-binding transcriptional MerR regulator